MIEINLLSRHENGKAGENSVAVQQDQLNDASAQVVSEK